MSIPDPRTVARISVVGPGRVGRAAALALAAAGYAVAGPFGRGEPVAPADVVLLCVPDREIAATAGTLRARTPLLGHTSGATPVAGSGVDFSIHPLRSFAGAEGADAFTGVGCAVAGTSPEALALAVELAESIGGRPFEVTDEQRAGYHAAASIASNFLVTLEAAAERVAAASGLPAGFRAHLAPLVRGTVENWAERGPRAALTGPIARGDEATVALQRDAIATHAPELLALFDELAERTRALARTEELPA
ncbi:DUF2520 domain-containing protein [Microbacterium sp.]|uniref:DUF2520 domain-containing protein n=1 Tax=Microbacterium sp. TaxID=51671 RepID=UPI0035B32A9F